MVDLVGLNGVTSYATGINNNGQVVGHLYDSKTYNYSGFIWEKDKGIINMNLTSLESYANKINDAGEIIGYLTADKFLHLPTRSFYYFRTKLGLVINLKKFTPSKNDNIKVNSINNRGWIVGQLDNKRLNPPFQPILLKPKKTIGLGQKISDLFSKL